LKYKGLLIVAGDLEQINDYKKEILRLSEGLNVHFVGLIKDKNTLLSIISNADLFIFPSTLEAMSMML
jgi:glycosyltransferase involved in cell wall biosynthesis